MTTNTHKVQTEKERALGNRVTALENQLRQLSRDVHDELGAEALAIEVRLNQVLQSLSVASGTPHDAASLGPALEQIKSARADIDGLYQKLRDVENSLFPEALRLGAGTAVADLQMNQANGFQVSFTDATEDRLNLIRDRDAQLSVYRFIQEALTNATKYAGNAGVVIDTKVVDGDLMVRVADSGPGFPEAVLAGQRDGTGLGSLMFRAQQIQGEFSMGNGLHETHRGACVCLCVPARLLAEA